MTTFTRLGLGLAATAISISVLTGCSKVTELKELTDAASTAVEQLSDTAGELTEVAAGEVADVI